MDQLKNPSAPKPKQNNGNAPKKEDNTNENLNTGDDIDFNQ